MRWIPISERVPHGDRVCLVIHQEYYPYQPIEAIYEKKNGEFLLSHRGSLPTVFPDNMPLRVTHWADYPTPVD